MLKEGWPKTPPSGPAQIPLPMGKLLMLTTERKKLLSNHLPAGEGLMVEWATDQVDPTSLVSGLVEEEDLPWAV